MFIVSLYLKLLLSAKLLKKVLLTHVSVAVDKPKSEPFPLVQLINCSVLPPTTSAELFNHIYKLRNSARLKKSRLKAMSYFSSIAFIISINCIDGLKILVFNPTFAILIVVSVLVVSVGSVL